MIKSLDTLEPFIDESLLYRVDKRLADCKRSDPSTHTVYSWRSSYQGAFNTFQRRKQCIAEGKMFAIKNRPYNETDQKRVIELFEWFRRCLSRWSQSKETAGEVAAALKSMGLGLP